MNSDLASRRNIADLSIQGTIETLKKVSPKNKTKDAKSRNASLE